MVLALALVLAVAASHPNHTTVRDGGLPRTLVQSLLLLVVVVDGRVRKRYISPPTRCQRWGTCRSTTTLGFGFGFGLELGLVK